MASKGTPVRTFRCQEDLWDEVIETIARRNEWSKERPWSISEFIGVALREKIDKMARGRKQKVVPGERLADPFVGK